MKTIQAWAILALTAGLAACGGGSTAEPPVQNEVPASATASTASFSKYAGSVKRSETANPLLVDKVQPPTSETDEPIGVQ
jgi:multidrug efflux pump subunit AcrA (membrane-fusion protein)